MAKTQRKPLAKSSNKSSSRTSTRASRQLLFIVMAFALGLLGLAGLTYSGFAGRAPTGAAAIGGPFEMISQDGKAISSKQLEGHPYLVFFGYTHCPDFCPTALFDISNVFKELGPDKKIAALFVTIDPARDKPEILKSYLENFDPRIIGLTGDDAQINAMAKAFKVYFKKVPGENGDYTMDHTGIVYLMDKQGRFVSAFSLSQPPKQAARELEGYL